MLILGFFIGLFCCVESTKFADQLYEDLLYYYNKNVRPVKNASDAVRVKFGASLIRLIDIDEVNQILTTNLWLEMQWLDTKLVWDPAQAGGIRKLHIPTDQIWVPDIVLYNNADGEPQITIMNDALVYYNGLVVWKPPSIYKSFCSIDIDSMKFIGWSYNGYYLDIRQIPFTDFPITTRQDEEDGSDYEFSEKGMDLSFFHPSLEWDLMNITSSRHAKLYPGCCGQDYYIDVTFELTLRRKPLFYTVNIVIPCMLIAILTMFVFYVPPIEHKIAFSISVLVAISVFYLVLIDLLPATSIKIPLIGKYLLFTMIAVFVSIIQSVMSLNFYRRDGSAAPMGPLTRLIFVKTLPKFLWLKEYEDEEGVSEKGSTSSDAFMAGNNSRRPSPFFLSVPSESEAQQHKFSTVDMRLSQLAQLRGMHVDLIRRMIDNIAFISDHYRAMKSEDKISDEWTFVANVFDRIILIIFFLINLAGTVVIALNSPFFDGDKAPLGLDKYSRPLSADTFDKYIENFSMTEFWENDGILFPNYNN
ncbi:hypothetical protein WR25_27045 [Diploscapter pachys]|uniref:Neurotransmitter-gated ion-channel ligand-binding domain-containing protein n=1 Tax=Diploscapter pachys TaxID=2018661 RepID=A0A2A2KCX9_9BILA|nr:hypothetical protein WR25_27045 [Diploscapter pachys]